MPPIGLAVGFWNPLCCAVRCRSQNGEVALSRGATPGKAVEAAIVAVLMEGGPAEAHRALVMRAIDECGRHEQAQRMGKVSK